MAKSDDVRDEFLDTISVLATKLRQDRSATHVEAYGKAVRDLGEAYESIQPSPASPRVGQTGRRSTVS